MLKERIRSLWEQILSFNRSSNFEKGCNWRESPLDPVPGGCGTLIFSNKRRLWPFLGFKILNFNIFWGGLRKINIFWVTKILWIFLGVITKLDNIYGSFLCMLRFSLKVKVHNWGIFGVAWSSWYFCGWTVDAGPSLRMKKKWEYPHPWGSSSLPLIQRSTISRGQCSR